MQKDSVFQQIFATLYSCLDPAICLSCGISTVAAEYLCPDCRSAIKIVTNPCQLCGLPHQSSAAICPVCLYDPPRWQQIRAPLVYESNLRQMILKLKLSDNTAIARCLVSSFIGFYHNNSAPQVLLPVPLFQHRLQERGFNQALEIAAIFSELLNIPMDSRSLKRIKNTQAQSGLSTSKRQKNMLKAFQYQPNQSFRHIAVIDDIVTTGSTANEITKVLHQSGVKTVEIWSLARVLKY